MNKFLEAAKNSEEDDSKVRYRKLKKEEAGTEQNAAEKRYQELKEEAKQEFVSKQRERGKEDEKQEDDSDGFVTY